MINRERYTEEDKDRLRQLIRDNAQMKVSELIELALQDMPGRSEPALKQQLFKLKRDGAGSSKKKSKVIPLPKAQGKAAPLKKPALVRNERQTPREEVEASEITLHIGSGKVRATGNPAQIAELMRQLDRVG